MDLEKPKEIKRPMAESKPKKENKAQAAGRDLVKSYETLFAKPLSLITCFLDS